jgi:hypothetical protein
MTNANFQTAGDVFDGWRDDGKKRLGRDIETQDEADEWYDFWVSKGRRVPKEKACQNGSR